MHEPRPPSFQIQYDVFVTSNGSHLHVARQLVRQLRAAGRTVFHDEDSVARAKDLPSELERALKSSRRAVFLIAPPALERSWAAVAALSALLEQSPQTEPRA